MKLNRIVLMFVSLVIVMMMISAVSANINETDTLKDNTITFTDQLDTSNDGDTIQLSNGTYTDSDVTINKSLTIIGDYDTTFDGESKNSLFTIKGNSQVTFKNIKFTNFYKSGNGAVFDIEKSSTVILQNCTFTDNIMAINNLGHLEIYDSYFNNNNLVDEYTQGGAISNEGNLYVENSVFVNSNGCTHTNGATIFNNGDLTINKTTIANAYAKEESKGAALFNNGKCFMLNSIIENNTIERFNFNYIGGNVYNQGNLTAVGNIFRNNTGKYVKPNTWYEGSPTIYNVGSYLNLSYNAFIGNVYFNSISIDLFNNGAKYISLDNNWWGGDDPLATNKVNTGNTVNTWIVLGITPEYSALNINESVSIEASFKLSNGEYIKENVFPEFNITLTDGKTTVINGPFMFDKTQNKGSYTVSATSCGFTKQATIDVGKIPVYIYLTTGNVTYPDDVVVEFTCNVNQEITVALNNKNYTVKIINGKGTITFDDLDAKTYDLNVEYTGDADHFKAFNQTKITVAKMHVTLAIENVSDIKADEGIDAKIILNPNVSPVTANLYINGIFNKTIYLNDSVNNLTFRNLHEGKYNITLMISETENYFSANASAFFSVGRYDPKIGIKVDDINAGENAVAQISAYNFTGNVVLSINGVNSTVLIKNNTNISISNLGGGKYNVSIIFKGDNLYSPSIASTSFNVLKNNPEFDIDITRENRTGIIQINTNANCTGRVGVYVNFEVVYLNLTNGSATFNVTFDSGTNYIFAFYEGDRNFENATYNTTIIIDEDFIIVCEDVEAVEYNNFTYSIVLVEKNRITMPNRNVTIRFNNQIYNLTTDNDGMAGITLNLASGVYTISASYLNQTVTSNIIVKQLNFTLNSNNISYGEDEIITVVFEGNVTGTVTFKIGDIIQSVDVVNSKASINISSLKIGKYDVSATYQNEIISKNLNSTFEVKKAVPTITVKTENILPGEEEMIEVSFSENIHGEVTIKVNDSIYIVEINDSKAILALNNQEIGKYDVIVTYDGNENYTNVSCQDSFSVRNETTTISLDINDSYYGQDLIIKAILNNAATGYVTFNINDISKTVDIINGEAICEFESLNVGTYRVDVTYSGDSTFIASSIYGFANVLKANSTINIVTSEVTLGENIMIYAYLPQNATGEVSFEMIGQYSQRIKQIDNGIAFWYISPLDAGKYTIIASYAGDANYNSSSATFVLKVSQIKSVLSVSINDASVNDRVIANIKLTDINGEAITGKVGLTIDSKTYNVDVKKGIGKLVIGKLKPGNYIFSAVCSGDDDYSTTSVSGSFKVASGLLESELIVGNVTSYYKGSQSLQIKLNSNNKAISGAIVIVKIGNKEYELTTDDEGKAVLDVDLNPGKYLAEVIFEETLSHKAANATAQITVLSTINSTDVVKLYGSGTQYFAMFFTSEGKALANTVVKFTINGKVYGVKTLANGIVRLNININPGTYKITAVNPQTGEKVVNTIRIYTKIMGNKDLTQYYGAGKYFKVRIYNTTNHNPVGAGCKVVFKVNKKTYTVKTDKNGYASLKISLKPGKYTITTTYNGTKVSNKITVKSLISAKNIVGIKVKKVTFKVKLVNKNGKIVKGKKITIKFKGKTYKVKTNSKGYACLILKNLKVGKYTVKSTYGYSKITNTIRIKK